MEAERGEPPDVPRSRKKTPRGFGPGARRGVGGLLHSAALTPRVMMTTSTDRAALSAPVTGSSAPFWVLGFLGVVARLVPYLANRSLWFDEALLALNVIDRPLWALAGRLDFNQAAPIGFLWLEKLAATFLGPGERALRLVPLLCGLCSLALFFPLARRQLARGGALVACGVFVLSQPLVYYASEVKQYSGDVLAALVIAWAAIRFQERPGARSSAALCLLGLASLLLSHPAAFVLAAVGVSLFIDAVRERRSSAAALVATAAVLWTAGFLVLYFTFLNRLTGTPYFRRFFLRLGGFPPVEAAEVPRWLFHEALSLLHETVGIPLAGLGLLCVIVGLVAWWRRGPTRVFFWVGPLALAGLAACLRLYPLVARTTLFAVPAIALLIGEGSEQIRVRAGGVGGVAYAALIILLFAQPAGWNLRALLHPPEREEIRPVLRRIERERRPGDAFYVDFFTQYALRYYIETRFLPFSGSLARAVLEAPASQSLDGSWYSAALRSAPPDVLIGKPPVLRSEDRMSYGRELDQFRGRPRVWMIFSHAPDRGGVEERRLLIDRLNRMGRRIESFGGPGAFACLYDLGGGRESPAGSPESAPPVEPDPGAVHLRANRE
jgi:Dolichyl-phosphate-mannose-protein mannosyltransferase